MKKCAGILLLMVATVNLAWARDWKAATVLSISESNVSGPLVREKHTMHYTVETADMVLLLEYSYHPGSRKDGAPSVAVNQNTKIAVGGSHAYILDTTGAEVKMHIVKRAKK
jgi:hypothetical protein